MASTLTEARKINAYFGEKAHNSKTYSTRVPTIVIAQVEESSLANSSWSPTWKQSQGS